MIKYNEYLNKMFGIELIKVLPREATKFARKYFKGRKINAIEIGILRGEHTKAKLNINKIILIDPYLVYGEYKFFDFKKEKIKEKAINRLKKFKDKIEWIFDFSSAAINKIKEKVDFIYIDGNHEYKYIKEDLELYWEVLNEGGIISGHDIQNIEVSKAVIEFCNKNKLDVHVGDRRDWWIIKK